MKSRTERKEQQPEVLDQMPVQYSDSAYNPALQYFTVQVPLQFAELQLKALTNRSTWVIQAVMGYSTCYRPNLRARCVLFRGPCCREGEPLTALFCRVHSWPRERRVDKNAVVRLAERVPNLILTLKAHEPRYRQTAFSTEWSASGARSQQRQYVACRQVPLTFGEANPRSAKIEARHQMITLMQP